jgi:hypothetical protein
MGCTISKKNKDLGISHSQQNSILKDSYAALPDKLIKSNTTQFQSSSMLCRTPEPVDHTFPTNSFLEASNRIHNITHSSFDALNDYEKINAVLSDTQNVSRYSSESYSSHFANYPTLLRNTESILNTASSTMPSNNSTDHYRFITEGAASISCKQPRLNIINSFSPSHEDLSGYNIAAKFEYIKQSLPYNPNHIMSVAECKEIHDTGIGQANVPVIKITDHLHLSCKATHFNTKFKNNNYHTTDLVDCIDLCEKTSPRACLTKFIYILPETNCEISHLSSFSAVNRDLILPKENIEKLHDLNLRQKIKYLSSTPPQPQIRPEHKISNSSDHQDKEPLTNFLTLPKRKSVSVESLQSKLLKVDDEKYNLAQMVEPDVTPGKEPLF